MKSKDQKRREAIERLERKPYSLPTWDSERLGAVRAKRTGEAKRLRQKFGYPPEGGL